MNKSNLFNDATNTAFAKNRDDVGFINSEAKSTFTVKKSGTTTMNSGIYAQYKCDNDSKTTTEISMQSMLNAVQREMTVNDLILNRHKFNMQLVELTNMVQNMNTIMGDLMVNSTVLVKAWEPTLQQYVLIRRPARFPVFGNLLDAYIVDDRYELEGFSEDLVEYKRTLNDLTVPEKDTDKEGDK